MNQRKLVDIYVGTVAELRRILAAQLHASRSLR